MIKWVNDINISSPAENKRKEGGNLCVSFLLVFAFSSSYCSHGEAGVIEKSSELVICDSPGFPISLPPQIPRAKKLLVSLGGIER